MVRVIAECRFDQRSTADAISATTKLKRAERREPVRSTCSAQLQARDVSASPNPDILVGGTGRVQVSHDLFKLAPRLQCGRMGAQRLCSAALECDREVVLQIR